MKNSIWIIVLLFLVSFRSIAEPPREGMWVPLFLDYFNIGEMQEMGMELTASDIYSEANPSLKDAIVSFGGYCTGSMISPNGLLLTNHHCGYGEIQKHSSVENDYLKNGFWAESYEAEKPNPGLTATFVVRIEDVTRKVLAEIDESPTAGLQEEKTGKIIAALEAEATTGTHYKAEIKPFFNGNEYYMFVTETYTDVRLVGAPPSAIGKFGGDTDNWMWPRHTGDFALFRVYANENNEPAEFHEDNVPYQPKKHLEVSIAGIEEGDFTMVFGFPGTTQEYLPSYAVRHIINSSYPSRIALRDMRLEVINEAMAENDTIRIQYASKQSRISNAWKKWQGEIRGLKKGNAVEKKEELEKQFMRWAVNNDQPEYKDIINSYESLYDQIAQYSLARDYVNEAAFGIEIVQIANRFRKLVALSEVDEVSEAGIEEEVESLKNTVRSFYKDYRPSIDKEILPKMLQAYQRNVSTELLPDIFGEVKKGDFEKYANKIFKKSMFTNEEEVMAFLNEYQAKDVKKLKKDPAYKLMASILDTYFKEVFPQYSARQEQIEELDKLYVQGLREMMSDKKFYPDANSTLRVSYGQVEGYEPLDGKVYEYYTTAAGILEKAAIDHPDYKIGDDFLLLLEAKEFGKYGDDGELPVAFIASNHSTGGNSGSPVLNGKGQLIGLNFDRNWEGTMSDIFYDPEQVRNISVDVRYILFVVDKYAGAEWLIEEMELK